MKLLTKAIIKQLPLLYSTRQVPLGNKMVMARFFAPWSSYTFYCIEGQRKDDDFLFWGAVTGLSEDEFGYISLKEMEAVIGLGGLKMERDLYWTPTQVRNIPDLKQFVKEG